jgi:hypothetical protein
MDSTNTEIDIRFTKENRGHWLVPVVEHSTARAMSCVHTLTVFERHRSRHCQTEQRKHVQKLIKRNVPRVHTVATAFFDLNENLTDVVQTQ